MDRGLYIAAAGVLAEQVRQDRIAGDLPLANGADGRRVGTQSTDVPVDMISSLRAFEAGQRQR